MLYRRTLVHPGEWVLVQAAGSGVGVYAVQIARFLGAHVIATAGSNEKLDRAQELGAEATINYSEFDVVSEVKRITNGRGVGRRLRARGRSHVGAKHPLTGA